MKRPPKANVIKPGDYVRFAYLPANMEPTPILVSAIAPNGMVQLIGRGWYQPHLLMVVDPPQAQRKRG